MKRCTVSKSEFTIYYFIVGVISWSGESECNVSRDVLLDLLSTTNDNPAMTDWGTACNKAVRQLYPNVIIKRKGKFKTYPFNKQHNIFSRLGFRIPLSLLS